MQAYGYFKKVNGKWVQQSSETFSRAVAVAVFQDRLIWDGGEIRPARKATPLRDPRPAQCEPCKRHLHTQCTKTCECNCKMFRSVNPGVQEVLL